MPWKCGVFGVIVEAYTFTRLLESLKKKKKHSLKQFMGRSPTIKLESGSCVIYQVELTMVPLESTRNFRTW